MWSSNSLQHVSLFRVLRKMKAAGDDFYHDGEWTAIRAVVFGKEEEDRLAIAFRNLLAKHAGNVMQLGMLLVWEGYVSPEFDKAKDRYYLVLTLEGWCPKTASEFDRELFLSLTPEGW
jgi:hypothetical protein